MKTITSLLSSFCCRVYSLSQLENLQERPEPSIAFKGMAAWDLSLVLPGKLPDNKFPRSLFIIHIRDPHQVNPFRKICPGDLDVF